MKWAYIQDKGGTLLGKKDIHTNNYFDDNIRFANLINGTLYKGTQRIKADELKDVSKEFLYTNEQHERKIIADNAKLWKKQNIVYALYSVENLSYIDYATVIRCMQMEAMGYYRQWKKYKREHERNKDTSNDEFLSGIKKSDSFYPIVPVVIYYGTEREWDANISLHDFLGAGLADDIKTYINNYKINLFDTINIIALNSLTQKLNQYLSVYDIQTRLTNSKSFLKKMKNGIVI